jgi:hypothetical protein
LSPLIKYTDYLLQILLKQNVFEIGFMQICTKKEGILAYLRVDRENIETDLREIRA